ncbi:hypothetical protein [Tistrella mobilis]|uniref:hypothetical protein n=1 Tax=Tistrella mobilis TaxID=171437 RepID=UPI00355604DB
MNAHDHKDFLMLANPLVTQDSALDRGMIGMTPDSLADFLAALSRPAEPVADMAELLRRPAPWEPGYLAKR